MIISTLWVGPKGSALFLFGQGVNNGSDDREATFAAVL